MDDRRLDGTPTETWANTILYRLAIALGAQPEADGSLRVDPDVILDEAIEHIQAWHDDAHFVSEMTLTDPIDQIVYTGNVPFGMSTEHFTEEI